MMNPRLAIGCVALSFGFHTAAGAGPRSLDRESLRSAVIVETIALPSPGEFLLAVDKHLEPNWTQLLGNSVPATTTARDQLALQLGVLLADAHVAIEAQDSQAAKNSGRDLIATARKLNVGQNVLARGRNIADLADLADWRTLREELDATQNDIRLSMQEQNDQDLLVFLMLGSWLRQMQLASSLIEKNPDPAAAALIAQPTILNHLLERLESLPPKVRSRPLPAEFHARLREIQPHMEKALHGPIPPESVKAIAAATAALLAATAEPPQKP